jgi:diguanylate cyclase (GGDEF)-like protein
VSGNLLLATLRGSRTIFLNLGVLHADRQQVANNLLLEATANSSMTALLSSNSEVGQMHDTPTSGYSGETRDLASLVEATSYSTLLCDVAGRIVQISGTPELVFGFDRLGLSQQSVLGAVPVAAQPEFIAAFNSSLGGHTPAPFHYAKPAPWGGTLDVELSMDPLLEGGSVVGVQVRGLELSLVKLINAVFAGDFDTAAQCAIEAPAVVYFLDGGGQCTSMNDRWTILSGQSSEDALGIGFLARVSAEEQARFRSTAAAAHSNRSGWRLQFHVLTAGETPWLVDSASASVGRPDGSLLGYVGVITPFSTALTGLTVAESTPSQQPQPHPSPQPQQHAQPQTRPQTQLGSDYGTTPQSPMPGQQHPPSAPTNDHAPSQPVAAAQSASEPHYQSTEDDEPTESFNSPSAPMPDHVLVPENISALESGTPSNRQWTAPIIKDGYTDAALLATPRKAEDDAEAGTGAAAPGVDKVTGLSNRLLFAQGVSSTVGRMQADALTVSVSFIDLHGLEVIRQSFGVRSTNDYLFLLARRLESTIRSIESCGRIDGDVLGVLSVNWLFAEDLPIVAQRLLTRLQEPLASKDGGELVVSMDLGMAVARPGEHVNDVFGRAWESLQRSKADLENQWHIDYGV